MKIKLFCSEIELNVQDYEIATLEIDNSECFRRITRYLNESSETDINDINEITVIDDCKNLIDTTDMKIIFNPFQIDINDKNNITKLYKYLVSSFINSQENIFSLNELSAYINKHFNNLILGFPIDLALKDTLTVKDFLKLLDVKFDCQENSLQYQIIEYLNANAIIGFAKLIIFVNLKSFLSHDELEELLQNASHSRNNILLIENKVHSSVFENERKLTIDSDMYCMIK